MRSIRISAFLLLFLAGFNLLAQNKFEWKQATAGGYTYKYVTNDPMQARFYTLKNGLTVILSVNKKEPRIQTFIPVRAGSNTDPRNHTGLAHYLEHMLFKGTDKYGSLDWAKEKPILDRIDSLYEVYNKTTDSTKRKEIYKTIDRTSNQAAKFAIANEYDKMMAGMGATGTNAFTSYEVTCYTEDIPTNAMDRFLTLQAERFRNPILRIFHTELEAVYEEKNRGLDNDNWKVEETLFESLFPTHNYGQQTTIGTVEHLKNPSLQEIRNYFYKYYVPNNMAVIMAGDFNPDEIIKKIDQKFAYMVTKPIDEYHPNPEAPLTQITTKEVFGPTPEFVTLGYRIPGRLDNESTVLAVLADEIMSNSKAGLIDLNLNKQQKIQNGTSTVEKLKDYSVWTLRGTPKAGQSLDEVKDLLLSQVDKLRKGDFDESILKAIVANYKLNAIQGVENNQSRAYQLLESFINTKGTNWSEDLGLVDAMSKVTKAQVVDFANKYYNNNYVAVYKRPGKDTKIKKIIKPPITPVDVNREAKSDFLKMITDIPMAPVQPVWVDFNKDLQKSKVAEAEVLYVQNVENELYRLSYRLDMGSWNTKLLPIATQYLQFLSTDKYSAEQISKEFYNIASNYSVTASGEITTVRISGLQENFAKAVELTEYLLKNCKPDEKALVDLKERILKQRVDAKKSKGQIMQGLSNYAMYGDKNPFNNQLSNDELAKLTSEDLLKVLHNLTNFKHKIIYYGPKPLAAFTQEIKGLHKLPSAFTPYPAKSQFAKITQSKNQVLFAEYDMVQAEIDWIRNTTDFNPSYTPMVDLFNNYFGAGMASIVFQTIRESKALAYSTYAYYATPVKKSDKYSLIGYIGCQADKLNESIVAMNELLNQMPESAQVFDVAKKSMKKTYETERIRQDGIIFTYLSALDKGIDYDERKLIYETVDKLTFNDMKTFEETNLAGKAYTYCIVASEKKINMEDLKKYGELKQLNLEAIFGY